MRTRFRAPIALAMLATAMPALAQEVIVTAQRRNYNASDSGYNNSLPATARPVVNLKRMADYIVLPVRAVNDTRDATTRQNDLNATIRNAIATADKAGVELAIGDYVLERLTLANTTRLTFSGDGRPDTSQTMFLAKIRVTPGMDLNSARERIDQYLAAVSKAGRSRIQSWGEPTLSVVNPDQYRPQIIDLIAADAAASAAKFGPGYGVEVSGLDRPVEWARAGPVEVFLYLPAAYTVRRD